MRMWLEADGVQAQREGLQRVEPDIRSDVEHERPRHGGEHGGEGVGMTVRPATQDALGDEAVCIGIVRHHAHCAQDAGESTSQLIAQHEPSRAGLCGSAAWLHHTISHVPHKLRVSVDSATSKRFPCNRFPSTFLSAQAP